MVISTALVLGKTNLAKVETVPLMAQTKSRLEIAGGKISTASANTSDILIDIKLVITLKRFSPWLFSMFTYL